MLQVIGQEAHAITMLYGKFKKHISHNNSKAANILQTLIAGTKNVLIQLIEAKFAAKITFLFHFT